MAEYSRAIIRALLPIVALLALSLSAASADERDRPKPVTDDHDEHVEGCEVIVMKDARGVPLRAVPLGPRNVLVIIADFTDATVAGTYGVTDPIDFVAGVMYDNTRNTAGVIAEASFGLHTLVSDADGDAQHDIVQVTLPETIIGASCNSSAWANLADTEATALGVDLGLYQHKMYVIPKVSGVCSSWAGLGQLGGSRTWIRSTTATVYAHEIGHNLGMHHASTDPDNDGVVNSEYGDISDIMGSSSSWRQFNGPHKVQMAWLPPTAITELQGGGSWTITLDATEIDPAVALNPQIIQIDRPDQPSRPYFLSYRAAIGYDTTMSSTYREKLQLHSASPASGRTHYIDGLLDGESFSDPVAYNLEITQLSHDATSVTIEIIRDEPDFDGDGSPESLDCDDMNPVVYPGAPEVCDHLDNNCDTVIDEGFGPCDIDGDGFDESIDCDDNNVEIYPGATEVCDRLDNNCDGVADEPDYDGDGAGNCTDICPNDPTKGGNGNGTAGGGFAWCPCGVPEDVDTDGDFIPDCADNCPDDPDHGTDDGDGDGITDCIDQCPNDPEKWNPIIERACPCGVPNVDTDGDSVWDCHDLCSGADDTLDVDLDGMPDCADLCPADPWKFAPGLCGCGAIDEDDDLDVVCDSLDNCGSVANPAQSDTDNDGVGNACDCAPGDAGVTTHLGPATGVRFTTTTELAWLAPQDTGGTTPTYDVVRSLTAWDFSLAGCIESDTLLLNAEDPDEPAGEVWFYVIRTRAACGEQMGMDSNEIPRSGIVCP